MIKTALAVFLALTAPAYASAPLPQCQAPAVCPNYAAGIGALPITGGTITGNLGVTGTLSVTGATTLGPLSAADPTGASVTYGLSAGSITVGTTDLVTNAANHRVGIGTASPDKMLDVRGLGSFQVASTSFSAIGEALAKTYLSVGVTTTTGAGAFPAVTHFATVTINANMLANNGDSLEIDCFGTANGGNDIRNAIIFVDGVLISSRPATNAPYTITGTTAGWWAGTTITRTGSSTQIYQCRQTYAGACASVIASPAITSGFLTLDLTASHTIACAGQGSTTGIAGEMSFLRLSVKMVPGP